MRTIAIVILSMVCATTCIARDYSRGAAFKAAASCIPKGQETEFLVIEIKSSKGDCDALLEMLKSARKSKARIALVSPKNKYIKANLNEVVKLANGERFDGVELIVVGEKIDPEMFATISKASGLDIHFAAY